MAEKLQQGRGFAGMDPDLRRAVAGRGGRAAHAQGVAHRFTPAEAREAGRKGGMVVSLDRRHMAEIGRKGGQSLRRRARGPGSSPPSSETRQLTLPADWTG